MAEYKLVMPKMGESVQEATILVWHKKAGDFIAENEILLEIATDKVDSDVPSPVSGILKSVFFKADDVVAIGETLAIIETDSKQEEITPLQEENIPETEENNSLKAIEEGILEEQEEEILPKSEEILPKEEEKDVLNTNSGNYSPLVLNITKKENIALSELENIQGSGLNARVTKEDILAYIENKKNTNQTSRITNEEKLLPHNQASSANNNEIIEMDRMRKLIAKNMTASKHISAHVSSFVECDVTKIVHWRAQHKEAFREKYGFNLTYLPVFIEAIAQAIKEFPDINISVENDTIIYKKQINIGIATALSNGNLIVPVIKNADQKNISGIAQEINSLANKARTNTLTAEDISGGTYTVSNIGTFGNIIGTPIIVQPQVAIMAVGAVTKKPIVIEINGEDVIAVRSMMYLSHTYDHRVVDGMLGGQFVKRVAAILEDFDNRQMV